MRKAKSAPIVAVNGFRETPSPSRRYIQEHIRKTCRCDNWDSFLACIDLAKLKLLKIIWSGTCYRLRNMLHSFMIISGRSSIVLYRKILTKSLPQPRLIAGLVTALCEFSVGSIGLPITTIELDNMNISVVEIPVDELQVDGEYLRAVVFHDTSDGDMYGHVLGLELLREFTTSYGERLLSMQLANMQGVEQTFRPFSAHVRSAIIGSFRPLMQALEIDPRISQAILLKHRQGGAFSNSLDNVWYASGSGSSILLGDVQALLSAGDDVLSGQRDETVVVTVGEHLRIERLDLATLIVVTAPPATYTSCHGVITACTGVLKRLFVLMHGLEGSRGLA